MSNHTGTVFPKFWFVVEKLLDLPLKRSLYCKNDNCRLSKVTEVNFEHFGPEKKH